MYNMLHKLQHYQTRNDLILDIITFKRTYCALISWLRMESVLKYYSVNFYTVRTLKHSDGLLTPFSALFLLFTVHTIFNTMELYKF